MVDKTSWGYYMQGSDQQVEIEELGSKLSLAIHCAVHYPAFGKNLFECGCGVIFPLFLLKGQDWAMVIKKHEEESKLAKEYTQ